MFDKRHRRPAANDVRQARQPRHVSFLASRVEGDDALVVPFGMCTMFQETRAFFELSCSI